MLGRAVSSLSLQAFEIGFRLSMRNSEISSLSGRRMGELWGVGEKNVQREPEKLDVPFAECGGSRRLGSAFWLCPSAAGPGDLPPQAPHPHLSVETGTEHHWLSCLCSERWPSFGERKHLRADARPVFSNYVPSVTLSTISQGPCPWNPKGPEAGRSPAGMQDAALEEARAPSWRCPRCLL